MTAAPKPTRRSKTRVRVRIPTATYEALALVARVRGETLDAVLNRAAASYIASAKEGRA